MFLVGYECGDAGAPQAVGLLVGLNDDCLLFAFAYTVRRTPSAVSVVVEVCH
jgi:hypothetical protein